MPKVSVIIPTYNRAHYICETIDSILAQTYRDYEIIVVDDGSTDDTRKVLQKYDGKVRYFYQKNRGSSAARNFGISQSQGEYIAFLDDDDLWLPNKLDVQLEIIEKNLNLAFVCSGSYVINEAGENINVWKENKKSKLETFRRLYKGNFVLTLTVLMRRRCFYDVGEFDERLIVSQDYDLWLRLAKKYKFQYINTPLAKYRIHRNNVSKNIETRFLNNLMIFQEQKINKGVNFLTKRVRLAKIYYEFATIRYSEKKISEALILLIRSILTFPFIGFHYWPRETENLKFTFVYRILKPYFIVVLCLFQKIFRNF
ncbi:MAG: hypothetical protein A2166_00420 [Omnitrophica WOR_2 bacterium RBG_13_41_10]|nr:MAG: hypothetical protein A2166_00420 [Omnitrophica WOR_2 bacterium RBG_13_41_10]